jgi:hypothetical protein
MTVEQTSERLYLEKHKMMDSVHNSGHVISHVYWIHVVQDRVQWQALVTTVLNP